MAKNELIETAKQLEAKTNELLTRVKELQTNLSGSLQQAKRQESKLIESERAAEKARAERDAAERLKEFLESQEQKGVYIGGEDAEPSSAEGNALEAHASEGAAAQQNVASAVTDAPAAEAFVQPEAKPTPAEPDKHAADISAASDGGSGAVKQSDIPKTEVIAASADDAGVNTEPTKSAVNADTGAVETEKTVAADNISLNAAQPKQTDTVGVDAHSSESKPQTAKSTAKADGAEKPDRQQSGSTQQRAPYNQQGTQQRAPYNQQGTQQRAPYNQQGTQQRAPYNQQGTQQRAPYNQQGTQQRAPYNQQGTQQRAPYNQQGTQQRAPYNQQGTQQRAPYGQQGTQQRAPYGQQGGAAGAQRGARTAAAGGVTPVTPAPQQRDRTHDANKGQYVRRFDDSKTKNKKAISKEAAPSATTWDDENGFGNRRKLKHQQIQQKPEPIVIDKAILTNDHVTVRELSEKLGKPAAAIIKKLFLMGTVATINNEIDFETCELIAADFDISLELQVAKTYEEVLAEAVDEGDDKTDLVERPPVVTIMGHVDHGKTSLLDAIRDSSITSGEAGGITQHIGAYTVKCKDRTITFIDTPGHEAFTAMRARGAQVTDVVILVVAADDGIMPQTVEAINHSKAAGVPIIVAINKMDRAEANPERVLQQLTEHGLLCEDWGGDTICVPVSARTHMGLDTLLEMVLLQADVLELKANPKRKAKGTVVEAQLDKGRGPVATVLVQNGTLHVGDPIVAGVAFGKVRAMMDDKGRRVKEAGPSQPVEVLGFNEVPAAGDEMNVADLDKLSKLVAEERRNKLKAEQQKQLSKVSLEDLFTHIAEGDVKDLNIVIKADVDGSVQAVKQSLEKLSNDEVRVKCIHGAVGAITASDVMFASASNAIVIGFNVRPDSGAKALAEQEKVDVRTYRIIYQAIEDVENAMKGMFKPIFKEVQIGSISVRSTFKVSGVGVIAGAYVTEGKVQRNAQVRVVRDGIVVHEGKIGSLRRFKDDVKEVAQGYECGISVDGYNDIHEGDVIEAFIMEEVQR